MTPVSDWVSLQEVSPGKRPVKVKCDEEGVQLDYPAHSPIILPYSTLRGWEFSGCGMALSYEGAHPGSEEQAAAQQVLFKGKEEQIHRLKLAFNEGRLHSFASLQAEEPLVARCPHCRLLHNVGSYSQAPSKFCPECLAIYSDQALFTQVGAEPFNFCEGGWFCQLGKESRDSTWQFTVDGYYGYKGFLQELQPTLEKMFGHFFWGLGWLTLMAMIWAVSPWVNGEWPRQGVHALMTLFTFHVVMIGFYVTGLVMTRSLTAWLRPLPEERLFRWLKSNQLERALQWMQANKKMDHPGFLANLAQAHFRRGETEEGILWLERAIEQCPNHPALLQMRLALSPHSGSEWESRLKEAIASNELH